MISEAWRDNYLFMTQVTKLSSGELNVAIEEEMDVEKIDIGVRALVGRVRK